MAHGGDLYRNHVELDFSVNINPLGMPDGVKKRLVRAVDLAQQYPDPKNEALGRALSEMSGIEGDDIIFGNGASELIMAVVHALRPEKILLPVPSFTGYERAARATDAKLVFYEMNQTDLCINEDILETIRPDLQLMIFGNPGNPTGKYTDKGLLVRIIEECRKKQIAVLLDETFMMLSDDPEANCSISLLHECPNLMILRSFTKTFAIPGVRLGYLLCRNRILYEKIKRNLPEWNISVFAQEAAMAMQSEKEYLRYATELIRTERKYLTAELEEMGFDVYTSSADFLLFKAPEKAKWNRDGADLYRQLLDRGVLIRKCDDYRGLGPEYYRIAVHRHEDNEILINMIRDIISLEG